MSYLVLARKWRPQGFDDLVGQEPIMGILKNAISQDRIAHAYLFSGPRGVGKTSSARILSKALNCKDGPAAVPCGSCSSCISVADGSSVDVIEIDGASNNSVDDIRDLREKVKYAPSSGKYKVYIIDEVHMLSGSAFNALLKTLEEPPPHVIGGLATTEMKKIPATVVSRCQHMPFRRIPGNVIRARLEAIAKAERISISPAAIGLVSRAADGSMRDSLTILDQLSSFSSEITDENVKSLLGIADFGLLLKIADCLIRGDRMGIIEVIRVLSDQGTDIRSFMKELIQFFRDLLVASVMRSPEDALDLSSEEMSEVKKTVALTSEDHLTLMLAEVMKAEAEVRSSSAPRLALEMALIKASFLSSLKPVQSAIEHISKFASQSFDRPVDRGTTLQHPDEPPRKKRSAESSKPAADIREGGEVIDGETGGSAIDPVNATDFTEAWERTVARIDPPLASKLMQATPELKGEELLLTLDGGHAVFEDSISRNRDTIEKILAEETGRKIRIKLTVSQKKSLRRKDLREKVIDEPLIREALELFDGRIVDVTPIADSGNTNDGGEHV